MNNIAKVHLKRKERNVKRYTMDEIQNRLGKKIYIKNLPNRHEKSLAFCLKKLFGFIKPDTAFKYVYSLNQVRRMLGEEDIYITDPWNNVPPIHISSA